MDTSSETQGIEGEIVSKNDSITNEQVPCPVRAAGGFFGCLIGLLTGLCLSLICVLPATGLLMGVTNSTDVLNLAVIVTIIIAVVTTAFGIANGPNIFGKLLRSIGDAVSWIFQPKGSGDPK